MGEMVKIDSSAGTANCYLAVPEDGQGPGILLLHAWWGLTPFFKQLADRLAREGFTVLATDLYAGQTADTVEGATALMKQVDDQAGIQHVTAGLDYLLAHPAVQGKTIGTVSFSMGGAYATWLSTLRPEIIALVLFYGGFDFYGDYEQEDFAKQTKAAFLGHLAEHDEYESLDVARELEAALNAEGKEGNFFVYPGTGHWFFEDNRRDVYDPECARLAWERTIEFIRSKLS
ncbi:MAG: dienelactone hydrolase family protein [Chloroflexia bacterium]